RELVALLNAAMARTPASQRGCWTVESDSLTVRGPNGLTQTLSLQEVTLLREFAQAENHFASRRQLVKALGYDYVAYDEQRLEAMISRLRKKLAPLGENPLKAAHGRGYVFTQVLRLG
ncbi:MAG: helix-turn-helix domain-containing protein, partial [Betaproteobacteria bacterium]